MPENIPRRFPWRRDHWRSPSKGTASSSKWAREMPPEQLPVDESGGVKERCPEERQPANTERAGRIAVERAGATLFGQIEDPAADDSDSGGLANSNEL